MYDYYDYSSTADTYNQANDLFSTDNAGSNAYDDSFCYY